jgi:hypothetical protein
VSSGTSLICTLGMAPLWRRKRQFAIARPPADLGDAASIAALSTAAGLDLVAHEMTMLAEQAGRIVTPAARGPENT